MKLFCKQIQPQPWPEIPQKNAAPCPFCRSLIKLNSGASWKVFPWNTGYLSFIVPIKISTQFIERPPRPEVSSHRVGKTCMSSTFRPNVSSITIILIFIQVMLFILLYILLFQVVYVSCTCKRNPCMPTQEVGYTNGIYLVASLPVLFSCS